MQSVSRLVRTAPYRDVALALPVGRIGTEQYADIGRRGNQSGALGTIPRLPLADQCRSG